MFYVKHNAKLFLNDMKQAVAQVARWGQRIAPPYLEMDFFKRSPEFQDFYGITCMYFI